MLGRDLVSRHWLIKNSFVECSQIDDGIPTQLASAIFSEHEYAEMYGENKSTAEINELSQVNDCEGL